MSLGWPRHSCTVQPGSWYIQQAPSVSASFGPLQGSLSAPCRPFLVSPPWGQLHNRANTLLPTSTCTWSTSTLGAPVGWGVGGSGKGSRGECKANRASWNNCPRSPLQLRAPACSALLAPLSHLYTRADTCTNTSQIIKVYLGHCLWLRYFCQWHTAHHSAWGTLAVQLLLVPLPATQLLTQPGETLGHVLLLASLMMSAAEPT